MTSDRPACSNDHDDHQRRNRIDCNPAVVPATGRRPGPNMRNKTIYRVIDSIDPERLKQFQAGMRKRYSDEHILRELTECARGIGKSPTMREFEADAETTVHPQTVI